MPYGSRRGHRIPQSHEGGRRHGSRRRYGGRRRHEPLSATNATRQAFGTHPAPPARQLAQGQDRPLQSTLLHPHASPRIRAFGEHPRAPANAGCAARGVRGEGDSGSAAAGGGAGDNTGSGMPPVRPGCPLGSLPACAGAVAGARLHGELSTEYGVLFRRGSPHRWVRLCARRRRARRITADLAIPGRLFDGAITEHAPQVERREDAQPATPQRTQTRCALGTRAREAPPAAYPPRDGTVESARYSSSRSERAPQRRRIRPIQRP